MKYAELFCVMEVACKRCGLIELNKNGKVFAFQVKFRRKTNVCLLKSTASRYISNYSTYEHTEFQRKKKHT